MAAKSSKRFERWMIDQLHRCYLEARKGKRKTSDEQRFERDFAVAEEELLRDILEGTYHPSPGVAFIIHDPVMREIVAAPFRDRVVHHFLFNITSAWWETRFSAGSSSCRKGKGTLYGQRRLLSHIRKATHNYHDRAFGAKLDIQGYFMSLDHDLLYERVMWGLEQQFHHPTTPGEIVGVDCHPDDREKLFGLLTYLWYRIIHDHPMRNVTIRGRRSDWNGLPKDKSLFTQPGHRGLVIGNLTSQLLSNIFMDQLDRFVEFDLGYKFYGRYVDDFYIIVPIEQKSQLLADVKIIERYLSEQLKLTLHPKKRLFQEVDKGIPFIGAKLFPGFMLPSDRARHNAYAAARHLAETGEGLEEFKCRMGSIIHLNSRVMMKKIFETFGWETDWED